MKRILTIGASTSKKSINKILAEYTGSLLTDVEVINIDLNNYSMSIFSVDLEAEKGFPEGAINLNYEIEKSDGFIISFAEHNGAYTAAFKNVFDWLSRINGKVWRDKPMLLLATSPGARGGQTVLELAVKRFPFNGGEIIGNMSVPSFFDNFKEGVLVDQHLNLNLLRLVENFQKSV
ncbi:NAD(P)H-dependent oxidoreductase [Lutibacter sp. A64]|uniref:NADPH-dependent FMN reductase n=1 Tax=Lutibacter sp. A64 TaxID=2918526 RepID=UPI001F064B0E|nr:NADPH-dependent FMN reductase [Lutibacter sp. A64]UMB54280.1 NAD(P)H-dependent oxidoreductase [Lutibacter sp. A64]